jgi:hypothetical protein
MSGADPAGEGDAEENLTGVTMTEAEWLKSNDPAAMLQWLMAHRNGIGVWEEGDIGYLPHIASDRKLQLWVEACRAEFDKLRPGTVIWPDQKYDHELMPNAMSWTSESIVPKEVRAALFREIVGNLWRPIYVLGDGKPRPGCVLFDPSWLTPDITAMAQAIYDGVKCDCTEATVGGEDDEPFEACAHVSGHSQQPFEPAALPILADALEESGCQTEDLLLHLRSDVIHVCGCWVIDLLLGNV